MKSIVTTGMLVVFAVAALSTQLDAQCKNSQKATMTSVATSANHLEKDIVDTAVGAGQFNTLVAAVKAAGLVDALKSEGPFTVFAPTDEAFKKLPKGTVEELLKPENKHKLVAILKYHVVSGKVMAKDVINVSEAKTLEGSKARLGLTIEGANIIKTDIGCSNGVIHVIDSVILPKK